MRQEISVTAHRSNRAQEATLSFTRCSIAPGRVYAIMLACATSATAAACGSGNVPPSVAAIERAPVASSTPVSDSADWLLAFIDVETTGLQPGWHEMIDFGLVMTDLDGRILDSLFLRLQPRHPERTSEGARRVNAFDAARWAELGALPPAAAVDSLRAFHHSTAGERHVLLVAFNSQFDTAFMDHLFRSTGSTWRELYHYFVLDIPSMAWSLGYHDLSGTDLARRLGVEDEPHVAALHTGITGAMLNVRIYQALLAAFALAASAARP